MNGLWLAQAGETEPAPPLAGDVRSDVCNDILYGAGFSGNGVGPSLLGARILASLVLGTRDEWAEGGLTRGAASRLPPEPIRYLGGAAVRRAVARKERAEDAGRRPGRPTRLLASLAPVTRGAKSGLT